MRRGPRPTPGSERQADSEARAERELDWWRRASVKVALDERTLLVTSSADARQRSVRSDLVGLVSARVRSARVRASLEDALRADGTLARLLRESTREVARLRRT